MKPYLETGIFRELKDPSLFNTVRLSFDTIEWGNEADLDPKFYINAVSRWNKFIPVFIPIIPKSVTKP